MNKVFFLLLLSALLAACAGKPRAGGPAPVESLRGQTSASATSVAAPAPPKPAVDVYAYRSPADAPSAPPTAASPEEPGGGAGTMLALRSETPSPPQRAKSSPPVTEVDPGLAPAIAWTPPPTSAAARKSAPAPVSAPTSTQAPATPASDKGVQAANTPPAASPPKTPAAAANPPPSIPVKPAPPPPPPKYTAPAPPAPALPAAASSLAAQAEQQRERGDYVAAAATLERAIRIQPREAYLWNRLARVRLDQNNYAQAGSLAQKSNALSKDQDQIKQDNWGMIATTRRAAGDQGGAQDAEAKAGGK